ncbi:helix-turn-helix transcriptional regulator [Xenorhabdus nematophila]|uniref:helix-turn-helix domain-containing protein n=1 Tax=Xenorhabdus nematophila TaxID=628 RepID=UPI0003275D39|nr:helix-turn-helix transcriptional regulator [Xenorhabdus nematophila]CEF28498.1 Helix-turn-helix domain protein [Xenorhabdus nematophila str. Websteri]AYA39393.1 XRE family transcriptional regulator [Xenorhabdus nematophila]MBA0017959.1 helix-turn-helix transcriptional regulator [Xenorhabdus nematophila]MCB4426156.1 transcriptional regulator [Xenorhabdus nematophila]QNJ37039.1 helix-turn-helix transcriptional regulator [Xenorhabdus nematophila]
MYKKQKMEHLRKNLQYLIDSRGETRVSICDRTGLNRTTIYNILDGRVQGVHSSTIQKVSNFFGVSYSEIETTDIAEKERLDAIVSYEGNMNPCAVPIFMQSECITPALIDSKIGSLIVQRELTYYFGTGPNIIAVLLENDFSGKYNAGDLLIIKRGNYQNNNPKLCFDPKQRQFYIREFDKEDVDSSVVIGDIMEERFGYGKKI